MTVRAGTWFHPADIADDLADTGLPDEVIAETIARAWECTRCVNPQFTNWGRYLAFTRIIVIGIIAEFRGHPVDVATDDHPLGYDLDDLLDTVFKGAPGHQEMAREYRAFPPVTADKSSDRRDSELFRRHVIQQHLRLRRPRTARRGLPPVPGSPVGAGRRVGALPRAPTGPQLPAVLRRTDPPDDAALPLHRGRPDARAARGRGRGDPRPGGTPSCGTGST